MQSLDHQTLTDKGTNSPSETDLITHQTQGNLRALFKNKTEECNLLTKTEKQWKPRVAWDFPDTFYFHGNAPFSRDLKN